MLSTDLCTPHEDLVGHPPFGRLTVIARGQDYVDPSSGRHTARWLCKCECGNTKAIRHDSLLRGNTKSCGCYSKEVRRQCGEFWSRRFKGWGRRVANVQEALDSNDF